MSIFIVSILLPRILTFGQFPLETNASCIDKISLSPVQWNYSAKTLGNNIYEIHLTAFITPGWHLYAQKQPEDAIAIPTVIKFERNPVVGFNGEPKEIGKLEKFTESTLGISALQYENKVDFVQDILLKKDVPTVVKGSITFQACTTGQCLPSETVIFTIPINN